MSDDFLALSVRDFSAATADKTPTPGGGSVAGAVGMLAAALGEMSLNFTRGKKKFAEHEAFYAGLAGRLTKAREMFADLVADDVAAYSYYQETSKLPDGPDKQQAQQTATAAAISVPREATALALAVLEDLQALSDKCNPWLITDLVAAAVLAAAVTQLSDLNVRVNVPSLADQQAGAELRNASKNDVGRAKALLAKIEQAGDAILDGSQ
ncbi:MAG: cyclodeaminase/cyclohydrolase family protein [Phycisphaerae bacterium]|nr:cyclodeaminase/cyclohydrolase family protein [Phycisphaerae bacterium]